MGSLPDVEGAAQFRSVRRPRQRGLLVASLNRHLSALESPTLFVSLCVYRFWILDFAYLGSSRSTH